MIDLGYPFDEVGEFYVIRLALEKDAIDEIIRMSETYMKPGRLSTR